MKRRLVRWSDPTFPQWSDEQRRLALRCLRRLGELMAMYDGTVAAWPDTFGCITLVFRRRVGEQDRVMSHLITPQIARSDEAREEILCHFGHAWRADIFALGRLPAEVPPPQWVAP